MGAAYYGNLVVNGIVEGLIIGLAALGINLVYAVARFPNVAIGDLMTVGAYAGIGVQTLGGRSTALQMLAGFVACAALAILYYQAVFRRLRDRAMVAPLLASIGLAFLTRSILSFFFGQQQLVFQVPIARAFRILGLRIQPGDLWLAGVALATVFAVFALLFLTPIGRRMRAVADNSDLARASGIRVEPVMLALWSAVGAVAAIAGIVLGIRTVVMPEMGWNLLLPAFAAAVLGGVGSPFGAVVAGVVLGVAEELSTPFIGFTYKIALSFIVLAGVLSLRPQGLFGRVEAVR
jgi:branched-chain amino acid transport system permease protein